MTKIVTTLGILAIFTTANAFAYFDNEMNEGVNHNESSEIYEGQNYNSYNYGGQSSYVNTAPNTNYQTLVNYQSASSQYVTPQMNNLNQYYNDGRNDNYYYPTTNQNVNYLNTTSVPYYTDSRNDNYYPYNYSTSQNVVNATANTYPQYYNSDNYYYPTTNQNVNPYTSANVNTSNTLNTSNTYPQYYNSDNYYRPVNTSVNYPVQYNIASDQYNYRENISSYCSSVSIFTECY